jgi:hypothetical protein
MVHEFYIYIYKIYKYIFMNIYMYIYIYHKAVPINKLTSMKIFMVYFAQLCCNTSANLHSDHVYFRWVQGVLYIVDAFFEFPFD